MNKTILITGSSGFIGSNLVDALLELNYRVIGVSRDYPLKKNNLPHYQHQNYIPTNVDINDFNLLDSIVKKYEPEMIVHLAAQAIVSEGIQSPTDTYRTNIGGTWNVLETSRTTSSVKRVIIASSDKAYGEHKELPYKEDFSLNAVHPYDISKKITEELAISFYKTYNVPIIITRCGNTFGPYDLNFSRIVPGTIRSCLNNENIILRSDGRQTRCYVYVKDIVEGYLRLIQSNDSTVVGEAFNFGNEVPIAVIDLVRTIKTLLYNSTSEIQILDNAQMEISNQYLDSSKALKFLNWKSNYRLEEALMETINWYEKYV